MRYVFRAPAEPPGGRAVLWPPWASETADRDTPCLPHLWGAVHLACTSIFMAVARGTIARRRSPLGRSHGVLRRPARESLPLHRE